MGQGNHKKSEWNRFAFFLTPQTPKIEVSGSIREPEKYILCMYVGRILECRKHKTIYIYVYKNKCIEIYVNTDYIYVYINKCMDIYVYTH